jgi:hypothetical protein
MRRILWVAAVLVAAVALSSCAKAPQADYDAAKAKLDEARQAEAQKYAPSEFQAASDTLSAAQTEMEAQNGKFALVRKYGRTKSLIASAQSLAENAKQAAIEGKERTKNEAQELLTQAQAAVDSASTMISKAPKGKETKQALDEIKNDLQGAQSSLQDAHASFDREDYLEAKTTAQAVITKANELSGEIQSAMDKYAAARGGRRH